MDIVITMGCGVACPFLPCKFRKDALMAATVARAFAHPMQLHTSVKKALNPAAAAVTVVAAINTILLGAAK